MKANEGTRDRVLRGVVGGRTVVHSRKGAATRSLAAGIVLAVLHVSAGAQAPAPTGATVRRAAPSQRVDIGKREFEANCASCHGRDGKGRGPITDLLRRSPPDLTTLAKANGGVLPMSRLYEVIEGGDVPGHGGRDMPIWGRDYRIKDAEYYMDLPYDAEALVRARILSLLEYIHRLQAR